MWLGKEKNLHQGNEESSSMYKSQQLDAPHMEVTFCLYKYKTMNLSIKKKGYVFSLKENIIRIQVTKDEFPRSW